MYFSFQVFFPVYSALKLLIQFKCSLIIYLIHVSKLKSVGFEK